MKTKTTWTRTESSKLWVVFNPKTKMFVKNLHENTKDLFEAHRADTKLAANWLLQSATCYGENNVLKGFIPTPVSFKGVVTYKLIKEK